MSSIRSKMILAGTICFLQPLQCHALQCHFLACGSSSDDRVGIPTAPPGPLDILITDLAGDELCSLRFPSDATVADVKEGCLQRGYGKGNVHVHLVHQDQKLDDSRRLDTVDDLRRDNKLTFCPVEFSEDDSERLENIKKRGGGLGLKDASDEMKNNKDVVLIAVRKNGHALQFASETMRNNKEVVLEAVRQREWALKHASDRMKDDKEVVLAAVRKDGHVLQYASDRMKRNYDVVYRAVMEAYSAKKHARLSLADRLKLRANTPEPPNENFLGNIGWTISDALENFRRNHF